MDLTQSCDIEKWIKGRTVNKSKLANVPILLKFFNTLNDVRHNYNGAIIYSGGDSPGVVRSGVRTLHTVESTPFFRFFKLTPRDFYITNFQLKNLWTKVDPNEDTYNFIKTIASNKYIQPTTNVDFDFSYILFAMQTSSIDLELWIRCLKWAKENKKHIVFKWHPHPYYTDWSFDKFSDTITRYNLVSEYSHFVVDGNIDYLIDNSYAVWSSHSGVNLQAILKNKPTAYFKLRPGVDYYELSPLCKTPAEAYASMSVVEEEKLAKFLTWYYHYVVVDVLSDNFKENLCSRLDLYFNTKIDDIRFLLPQH